MIAHRPRASRHAAANAVVAAWLVLSALAVLARDRLPAPDWLLIHVFLLGAVTNAVVAWTDRFAAARLRLPAPARWWPAVRLLVLNAGIAAVLRGATNGHPELATAGAAVVVGIVCAHVTVLVVRSRRAWRGRSGHLVAWYACSGLALIAGGTLGGWMASGRAPAMWHMRLEAAHMHVNLLGWVGLAMLGTLHALWPAVLRVRGTAASSRLSLRLAVPGLVVAAVALSAGARWIALAGLLLYTAGAALALVPFVRARRRPHAFAAWMLAAAAGWFLAALAADAAVVATRPPAEVAQGLEPLLAPILGGFVLLAVVAVIGSLRSRVSPPIAGVAAGCLLTALAVAFASSGQTGAPVQTVAASGTRVVEVTLANMRIRPGTIEAPPGTRLVLKVTNKDAMRHDLRLESGQATPMLGQGESATLTVPSVKGTVEGWCTVPGHRAAGMTMQIKTASSSGPASAMDHQAMGHTAMGTGQLDLAAAMSPGWKPYDAVLKPAPGAKEHRVELRASDRELEVAPGVRQTMWTFGGTVPAPVLRGKVGDVFVITLVNDSTMGHGIDFHAGTLAPDVPMRTIQPGERLTYRFKAQRAGAWLYHCSTMPMLQHIANGMYGAVVIDPPDLPRVDREYVLVQGELYLGQPGSDAQVGKMREGRPDAWMFNGTAAGYDHAPLTARAGDRVRVWVVDAGPSSGTAFHIVGAQFDTVYKEGAYLLRKGDPGGAQILDLAPGQGGFVETVVPEPGHYPFVDHDMRHGESGAHGILKVTR
ncbi:multicopper oxidase domain-containing protein [Actinomadura bangladeshensis]|uniref:multicopper oxidase domain-containing protein n=1 Tax=Actinomadura bangladeshensis TaxID=453573 RepID=UPI001FB7E5DE|nr:multicopper oxidase domain-containing protein [Actinomadura bangladeshensis]